MKKHIKNNRQQKTKKVGNPDKTGKVRKSKRYVFKRIRNEDEASQLPVPVAPKKKVPFYQTELFENLKKLFWKIALSSPVTVPIVDHFVNWIKHFL